MSDKILKLSQAQTLYQDLRERIDALPTDSDIPEVPVQDVQVNGTSILNNGVANLSMTGGITEELKAALLQIASKVAYIDGGGQTYYQELYAALYADTPATLSSITANLDTGEVTIYTGNSLDDLKQYLTVTAYYSNGISVPVNDYILSGTLSVGTNTITATYGGKTDTFSVTVTATPATLSSISASFNPGAATIYESTSLDSLKQYLTVTATYSDSSTTTVVSTNYTLSGTLTVGTSTVTVTYSGKTTTFNVAVSNPPYAAETIYSNYTAAGQRFSTGDISIDFAAGDYVEAVIDASSEDVVSQTNLISVAKDGNNDYLNYSTGEAMFVYKRDQSETMKILFRIKDTANNVAIDKWVVPNDFSNLVIKIDKNGVYLDGTAVSGVSASTLAFLTGQSKIAIGARASKLSYATYNSVKVYRLQ